MKLTAKSITTNLQSSPSLRNRLFNYLTAHPEESESKSMQRLLDNGLKIEEGTYHDHQLSVLQSQIDALTRNANLTNKFLEQLIKGQGDIQSSILNQIPDEDFLINPKSKRKENK